MIQNFGLTQICKSLFHFLQLHLGKYHIQIPILASFSTCKKINDKNKLCIMICTVKWYIACISQPV